MRLLTLRDAASRLLGMTLLLVVLPPRGPSPAPGGGARGGHMGKLSPAGRGGAVSGIPCRRHPAGRLIPATTIRAGAAANAVRPAEVAKPESAAARRR